MLVEAQAVAWCRAMIALVVCILATACAAAYFAIDLKRRMDTMMFDIRIVLMDNREDFLASWNSLAYKVDLMHLDVNEMARRSIASTRRRSRVLNKERKYYRL
jgi:hypothetical protein